MKKLLKIVAGLVAFIILALLTAPLFISGDMLKTRVAAELSKATGRTIAIEGKASLTLFPDIAVTLEQVQVGNPAGQFAHSHMFSAKKLDTGVKLMPLLHKEIIITGLTLEEAQIHLEQNAAGVKNWEFKSSPGSETKQEKTEKGEASKFAIGDINVKDSAVTYSTPGAAPMELSGIDVTLSGADGSEPLSLDGNADYKGEEVKLSLDVKDSRGFLAGKSSDTSADISLPGGTVSFDGLANGGDVMAAKGDLKMNVSSLPSLMKWATGKPPAKNLPSKLSLSGPVEVAGKRISFSKLSASADDIRADGALKINAEGAVPAISGNLHLNTIDTSRFSDAPAAQGNAPAAGGEGWSDKPMDLSGLKAVNADLGLTIDGIKSGKLEIGETATKVNLQGGSLQLGIQKMVLYQGNAQGSVALSSGGLATDLDVSGVQIEPLLTALNGESRLKGTGALNLNLRGSGNSQKAIVSTLGGTAKLLFRDGAIKGIDIGKFLRDVKSGFLKDSASESTDFSELSGTMNFANGIGSNDDLKLMAPVLRVTGKGTVNMPARSVNYRLMPTLVQSAKGQGGKDKEGLTVPIQITGSWSNLTFTPDLASMIQEGLKDPEKLKENLKGLKEGFKDLNSPKDIGKALLGGGSKEAAPAAAAPATTEAAPATATEAAPAAAATTSTAPAKKKSDKEQAIEGLFKALSK